MINGLRWAHETEDEGDDDDEGGAKAKKKLSSKKRGQKAKAKSSHKGSKGLYCVTVGILTTQIFRGVQDFGVSQPRLFCIRHQLL